MLIAAFFCCMNIPLDMFAFFFDRFPVYIKEFYFFLGEAGNFFIFNKIYISGIF